MVFDVDGNEERGGNRPNQFHVLAYFCDGETIDGNIAIDVRNVTVEIDYVDIECNAARDMNLGLRLGDAYRDADYGDYDALCDDDCC